MAIDYTLRLKALVRAIGFYPTYKLQDEVNQIQNCYYVRGQALTVYTHFTSKTDSISIRHTGRNRVDNFELKDNTRLSINQIQGKEISHRQLYNRLEKIAERVFTVGGMRQIMSDTNHYYNHNINGAKS
jgi:hypothetical protein